MKAEISRLWPASLNTHCPPGVCVPCVAFVLECEVSRDSAVEENEVQLEIPQDAALAENGYNLRFHGMLHWPVSQAP